MYSWCFVFIFAAISVLDEFYPREAGAISLATFAEFHDTRIAAVARCITRAQLFEYLCGGVFIVNFAEDEPPCRQGLPPCVRDEALDDWADGFGAGLRGFDMPHANQIRRQITQE